MDRTEQYNLIKQAIQQYYSPEQWLIIQLKNSWESEGDINYNSRTTLKLSNYATLELTQYNRQPQIHVYVGLSPNPRKRPKWLSILVDCNLGYEHVEKQVRELLTNATLELQELTRGLNHSITLHSNEVYDVSNQLRNE